MRWQEGGDDRKDIDDRRDEGGSRGGGGGGGGFPLGALLNLRGLGLGGTLVVLALGLIFGRGLLSSGGGAPVQSATSPHSAAEERLVDFVGFVFNDVQKSWTQTLSTMGKPYRGAKLVIYRNSTSSGCGEADSAVGPFYCPADEKVYIDLGFYRELRTRFGAPGQFAEAYVIAHEVGHHIQNLLGIDAQVRKQQSLHSGQQNALSVRLELQADCFAGIWARSTDQRHLLEAGDVEQAMTAAASVGDDRLQKQATGRVTPETWTHGSSAERTKWFTQGFTTGSVAACDTFSVAQP